MGHLNFRIIQELAKAKSVAVMGLSNFDPSKTTSALQRKHKAFSVQKLEKSITTKTSTMMKSNTCKVTMLESMRNWEVIYLRKYNTHALFTNVYTPQQKGVAERHNRTLLERKRAFLIDANLPQVLCIKHIANLINMTPSSVTDRVTPHEKRFKRKPSAHYIKVFGCTAYAHIPELY
ncbi:Retrotransposon protein, unclassified [Phytophthora palmivora]|uniref:Retrotransposon protein, unclassified n=1 Tax=Phytophthora palmivora TaxID=4796 RepID=A0A2P4YVS0_9STRA|nr:Retrotransposon protein, unclassified [Phytophthora palmivora]